MRATLRSTDRGTLWLCLLIGVVLPAAAGLGWRYTHPDFFRTGASTHLDGEAGSQAARVQAYLRDLE